MKRESPAVIWFTGISGAGKSTLARRLSEDLQHVRHEWLDGDDVRAFFPAVGFSRPERLAHLRYMAFLSGKLEKNGTLVIGSFITPYEEARAILRTTCERYIEVFVDTPLAECEKRDVKGLYQRARKGELASFTALTDDFEHPRHAEISLKTMNRSVDETYAELKAALKEILPDLWD